MDEVLDEVVRVLVHLPAVTNSLILVNILSILIDSNDTSKSNDHSNNKIIIILIILLLLLILIIKQTNNNNNIIIIITILSPLPFHSFSFAVSLAAIRYCPSAAHSTYNPELPKPHTCSHRPIPPSSRRQVVHDFRILPVVV